MLAEGAGAAWRLINRVELNRRSVVACVLARRPDSPRSSGVPMGNVRFNSHREKRALGRGCRPSLPDVRRERTVVSHLGILNHRGSGLVQPDIGRRVELVQPTSGANGRAGCSGPILMG